MLLHEGSALTICGFLTVYVGQYFAASFSLPFQPGLTVLGKHQTMPACVTCCNG